MTIRTATGIIATYMRACKFDGWVSFWRNGGIAELPSMLMSR